MSVWRSGVWCAGLPLAFVLVACVEPAAEEQGTCALTDAPELIVARSIKIGIADDAGVSVGFDLDGETTAEDSTSGCGIGDYVSASGTPGIDNAFSRIVPTLNATEAKVETIEGLVQDTIDNGELLIAFEVGGVDDWGADSCVAVEVAQAEGDAMLGTDGRLLDGQTFDREADAPTAAVDNAQIADSVLRGDNLSIDLPVQVLNAALTLPLRSGKLEITPDGDDLYQGVLAGAISAAYLLEVASTENVDPVVADLLGTVVGINADLPDEAGNSCAAMSMTLTFEGVGAYYYE